MDSLCKMAIAFSLLLPTSFCLGQEDFRPNSNNRSLEEQITSCKHQIERMEQQLSKRRIDSDNSVQENARLVVEIKNLERKLENLQELLVFKKQIDSTSTGSPSPNQGKYLITQKDFLLLPKKKKEYIRSNPDFNIITEGK